MLHVTVGLFAVLGARADSPGPVPPYVPVYVKFREAPSVIELCIPQALTFPLRVSLEIERRGRATLSVLLRPDVGTDDWPAWVAWATRANTSALSDELVAQQRWPLVEGIHFGTVVPSLTEGERAHVEWANPRCADRREPRPVLPVEYLPGDPW